MNDSLLSLRAARRDLINLRVELLRRQMEPSIVADCLNPALDALSQLAQTVERAMEQMTP